MRDFFFQNFVFVKSLSEFIVRECVTVFLRNLIYYFSATAQNFYYKNVIIVPKCFM